MSLTAAARIARRELRGGLRGFKIFLACLTLGVGAIAAVGSVRVSIQDGLSREGAVLLGGDAEMHFTYRYALPRERAWMADNATQVSEMVDFRSMAVVARDGNTERGLAQVKAVDNFYPLYGSVGLTPEMPLETALNQSGGLYGAAMQQVLIDRLDLSVGDIFSLGSVKFRLTAALSREPDNGGTGFSLGPKIIVLAKALAGSGLLEPGSLFDTHYRLQLADGADLQQLEDRATELFRDTGLRWRDKRNGAPGVERFVERIGSFLVLVGLAGLAVGGIGVSAAVRAYLDSKTTVIATLKSLGADGRTIFQTYFLQIGVLTLVGVALGMALGAVAPLALAPVIQAQLPVPAAISLQPAPLLEAGLYGILTALLFTLWPLARAQNVRAATLYRQAAATGQKLPGPLFLLVSLGLLGALVALAAYFSGIPSLAYWSAAGILAALTVLLSAALLVRRLAAFLAHSRLVKGQTALRLAFGAVGGPGGETTSVVLSLGLGLTVLAAVGQIDANLRGAIERDLPEVAPAYFFIDIQNDQLPGFLDRVNADTRVSRVDTAPMLRGVLTRINSRPAREVAGDHWVITGDRGITYSDEPPKNSSVTQGDWWPKDYTGPPLVSFAEEEALELGLKIGDDITLNILGRDITAKIVNFRVVDFSDASINFVLTLNPGALAGAPHTHIATVYATKEAEAPLLRDVATAFPNITAIRVRDAIARVSTALKGIAAATSYGAAATLLTGFVVLIGAAAAGEPARVFEAAVLKTVGAERRRILASFALRSAILGGSAGLVAIGAGALAGWAVMTFVMDAAYRFEPVTAVAIVIGGASATLISGLIFAWRPLATRPAQVLRSSE